MSKKPSYKELEKKIELLEEESERFKKVDREYRSLFTNSTDLIFLINKDYRVTSINPQGSIFLNKTPEKVVGKSIQQLFPEEISKKYSDFLKKVFNKGDPSVHDSKLAVKNREYWINTQLSPVKDKNGDVLAIIGVSRDITEQKQAEEALRESEEKYRELFNTSQEGIVITSLNSTILDANSGIADMLGYTVEELKGKNFQEFTPEKWYEIEAEAIRSFLGNGFGSFEKEYIRKDGTIFPISLTGWLIKDKEGNPEKIGAFIQDISQRKRADEEIARSEAFHRDVIENAAGVPFRLIFGPAFGTGHYEFVGAGIDKLLGIPADEFTEKSFNELIEEIIPQIPELTADSEANRKAIIEGHILQYKTDIRIRTKHNQLRWLSDTSLPLKDKKTGKVIGSFGILQDITERKRAEEGIKKFLAVVEQATDGIAIADCSGTLLFANEAWIKMHGYVSDVEFLGQNLKIFHDKKQFEKEVIPFNEKVMKKGFNTGEVNHIRKDGTPFPTHMTTNLLKNEKGESYAIAAIARDLTEKQQMEEALKKSEEKLRQIQKLEGVGQLAGGIAHDINNILTAIIGNTELALRGLKSGKDIHNNLEQVMSSGRKGGELIAKILAFSHRQIIHPQVINVNSTILNLAGTLHRVISEDIKVEMELHDNISPIKADPTQMEQILINLAVNARDAINQEKQRKIEKVITIKTEEVFFDKKYVSSHMGCIGGKHILIAVTDHGVGIAKETINRIFEPFFTTKATGKGTGLGLSTVYGIVKQNQGSIDVHSKPGEGTTIKIYWPAFKGEPPIKEKVRGEKVRGGE